MFVGSDISAAVAGTEAGWLSTASQAQASTSMPV